MSIPTPQRENLYPTLPITAPFPSNSQRENLYPALPVTAPSPPNSRLAKTYHSLMLADLEKYRDERLKQLTSNSKTIPTTSLTTPYSNPNTVPVPPPRGTKRYCTWRCKSWRRHRSETVCECECGFEHDIVHPSEWRGTPAEAAWDYSVGVRNGGWGYRERRVRWADPVVTDVLEGKGWGRREEREGEEEESEEKSEEEEDGEEEWVMIGRWSWSWGVVSENPDEEMEDAFEELDPSLYLGVDGCTGMLADADSRSQ